MAMVHLLLYTSNSLAVASLGTPRLCTGGKLSRKVVQCARHQSRLWAATTTNPNFSLPQVRAPRWLTSQQRTRSLRLSHVLFEERKRQSFSGVRAQMDEEAAAAAAAPLADSGAPTIFDKIISKQIPSTVVYEDDKVLAFRDINPQAPVHIILIPKNRDGLTQLAKANEGHKEILGHLLYVAKVIAEKEGLADGFRVVINDGPNGCQSVYHLHLHIIGGRKLKWPPG